MHNNEIDPIKRLSYVLNARGRGRSAHYGDIERELFTKPVTIGPRAVGWPASEVAALNQARVAGRNDGEIRELVKQLHAKRKVTV